MKMFCDVKFGVSESLMLVGVLPCKRSLKCVKVSPSFVCSDLVPEVMTRDFVEREVV